jgi:hypothetical protein
VATNESIPLFSSDHAEEPVLPGMGCGRPANRSGLFAIAALFVTVAAIGFAVYRAGNPVVLITKATTALLARLASPEDGTRQFVSGNESTAEAQELPPNETAAPKNDETAPLLHAADRKQTEMFQPTGIWLRQFQAWAAGEDARTPVSLPEPSRAVGAIQPLETVEAVHPSQPLQDAAAQLLQVPPVQRHRQTRGAQNARAEVISEQTGRAKVRPPTNARAPIRRHQSAGVQVPVQNARTQYGSGQGAQPSWLAQRLGWID